MPALRSSFQRFILPSLVITAALTGGLEAWASQAGQTLRDCGRSYAPCRLESLLVRSEPATTLPRVVVSSPQRHHATPQEQASA